MNYHYENCTLCPRSGADRRNGAGACRSGVSIRLARAALHFWEEPCISGTQGSGAVFFSGCPLNCLFCQNEAISHGNFGRDVTPERLAGIFRELEAAGAANINLVTPTHWAAEIRSALDLYRPRVPVLYNCGGYESTETLRLLEGYIDVYLPDIKYADADLARKFSGIGNYPDTAFAAVAEMLRQVGNPEMDERGMIRKGVLIRHLVLPLHVKDSCRVMDRIVSEFGTETWLSLLFQYTPVRDIPGYPELSRSLTPRERKRAQDYMIEKGLLNGYVQEPMSSSTGFIPSFDLTGI